MQDTTYTYFVYTLKTEKNLWSNNAGPMFRFKKKDAFHSEDLDLMGSATKI